MADPVVRGEESQPLTEVAPNPPDELSPPLPGPSAEYLHLTRRLREAWTVRESSTVETVLRELRADEQRVFGPLVVPSDGRLHIEIQNNDGERHVAVSGFPSRIEGRSSVLLARGALLQRPDPEHMHSSGWVAADGAIRDGAARFACGRLSAEVLKEVEIMLDPAPDPGDFMSICLIATPTLRQGPTSTFARMMRELTPYLMQYRPNLYVVEGAYRTILKCGLLRGYPSERLHCLPPGRLGALVDVGAAIAGHPVAALEAAFGSAEERVSELLELTWTLDCVIYLIDPEVGRSMTPETLALERECAEVGKPFLDTYRTIVEWFNLLQSNASPATDEHTAQVAADLASLGLTQFPYSTLALLAHDDKKRDMARFVQRHFTFLSRFEARIGSGGTAALLNDTLRRHPPPDRLSTGVAWVKELKPGRTGGNLQLAESLAMGLYDAALCFSDPRPSVEPGVNTHLFERTARIANPSGRLANDVAILHDARSADLWALMWTELDHGPAPITLVGAFVELFGVDLLLADADTDAATLDKADLVARIDEEAAWCLASAIAARRTRPYWSQEPKRVTISCGNTMKRAVMAIDDPVAGKLNHRIGGERERHAQALAQAVAELPMHSRRITRIAARKEMSLRTTTDNSTLWSAGPVVVAPMIGAFALPGVSEANMNAKLLATTFGGEELQLTTPGITEGSNWSAPPDLIRHWASTDVAVLSGTDLAPDLFGGSWEVPPEMYHQLKKHAVGEVAGMYLDAEGREVSPTGFVRNGMSFDDLRAVAKGDDGRASILVMGPTDDVRDGVTRVRTALAALRAGVVSSLVTDVGFARAVLREHAAQAGHAQRPSRQPRRRARSSRA